MQSELLASFISERYQIFKKRRLGLPPPWTQDQILSTYRFTNVFREDDPVTVYIKEWLAPVAHHRNVLFYATLARLFNNVETLATIKPQTSHVPRNLEILGAVRRLTGRVFNPAYMVSTCGVSMDKVEYVVNMACRVWAVGSLEKRSSQSWRSLEGFARQLTFVKGFGTFFAGQLVGDLKHLVPELQTAPDWWTWAAPGPGSIKGLNYAMELKIPPSAFLETMASLQSEVTTHLPRCLTERRIDAQNFQNCLCEYSKYRRTVLGTGVPKQRFWPKH